MPELRGLDHRECGGDGDGGVEGIAAALEHLLTRLAGKRMSAHDRTLVRDGGGLRRARPREHGVGSRRHGGCLVRVHRRAGDRQGKPGGGEECPRRGPRRGGLRA